ncbi:MAG: hypothetical protein ACFE7R_11135 [Candidatus Hodarchaeota archaeon]
MSFQQIGKDGVKPWSGGWAGDNAASRCNNLPASQVHFLYVDTVKEKPDDKEHKADPFIQ